MPKSSKIHEIDLRPYQTHFLFESGVSITPKKLDALLEEIPKIIDESVSEDDERSKTIEWSNSRSIGGENLAWLAYSRRVAVQWASGPDVPKDLEHHLVVLVARSSLLSVVATDKALGSRLGSGRFGKEWPKLKKVVSSRLEKALVSGPTRTLWLSGIHRSVATKPDSKVLIGPDIEASLDALGDQSYQYTSTRCKGPAKLPASFVGVTPRMAKVWFGPSADWQVFLSNSQQLLRLVESPKAKDAPYPVLARPGGSLKDVKEAFDVSFAAPEYLYEDDPLLVVQLENALQNVTWTVKGENGPDCLLSFNLPDGAHELKIELKTLGGEIRHLVKPVEQQPSEKVLELADLCGRPNLLKIFYNSIHVYSDGQIFEVRTRPFPFELQGRDFSGYDVTLEKPRPAGANVGVDLSRIGENGEPSLFTWVWKRYKKGWLWCDDGAGEIADFIHLNDNKDLLSLIHVKAANSDSNQRKIAVAPYEIVCSQALKNLRYTERRELELPLKKKLLRSDKTPVRGWRNGNDLPPKSTALWSAINAVRYSDLQRRVVIVQPHVRKSILPSNLFADTAAAKQTQLLFTLLHGIKADVDRYGVEFEVIVDK